MGRIQLENASIGAISRFVQFQPEWPLRAIGSAEKVEAHLKISSTSEISCNPTGNKEKKTSPGSGRYPQLSRAGSALAKQNSSFLFIVDRTQARNAREAGFE